MPHLAWQPCKTGRVTKNLDTMHTILQVHWRGLGRLADRTVHLSKVCQKPLQLGGSCAGVAQRPPLPQHVAACTVFSGMVL